MLFRARQPMPIDRCLWFSCRRAPKRGRPFSAFVGRRHESGLRVPPPLSSLCPTWLPQASTLWCRFAVVCGRFRRAMPVPLLRSTGPARFSGDVRLATGGRLSKPVADCFADENVPAMRPGATSNLGDVTTWPKAFPARCADPSGATTNSVVVLSEGTFSHLEDMSPSFPWQAASFVDCINAL